MTAGQRSKPSLFKKWALALLIYTLMIIVWGAWVRISKSGDGCGENWPLCHGQWVPWEAALATWIEFIHRFSSGVYGFLILGLLIWALRRFPRGHWVRWTAGFSAFFTLTEALLGARLVLGGLVGDDDSPARAATMALHLVNSLMLTGSLALTWQWAEKTRLRLKSRTPLQWTGFVFLLLGFLMIGSTGAIASLSKTLFPAETLTQAFSADWHWQSGGHFLLRLRIWHPLAATFIAIGIAAIASHLQPEEGTPQGHRLKWMLGFAVLFGYSTLFLLSPVWMKLAHLTIAHFLWANLLIFLASVFVEAADKGLEGDYAKN